MNDRFWFPNDPYPEGLNESEEQKERYKRRDKYWLFCIKGEEIIACGNDYESLMFQDWLAYYKNAACQCYELENQPGNKRKVVALNERVCEILAQDSFVYDWRHRLWRLRRGFT